MKVRPHGRGGVSLLPLCTPTLRGNWIQKCDSTKKPPLSLGERGVKSALAIPERDTARDPGGSGVAQCENLSLSRIEVLKAPLVPR